MAYLKYTDGQITYPYLLVRLHADYPNTSFPLGMTAEELKDFDVHKVVYQHAPAVEFGQIAEEGIPTQQDGQFIQTWTVRDMTEDEKALVIERLKKEAFDQAKYLLAKSDWTQLQDSPLSQEVKEKWALYRTRLRELKYQGTFPFEIDWPEAP